MKKTILLLAGLAFIMTKNNAQTVTDIDSNIYHKVIIGKQIWLKENLKTTRYRNGDSIPNIKTSWGSVFTDAYANYNNNPAIADTFGRFYNYFAVIDTRGLCPSGWHVPTETEWGKLVTFLGGDAIAGSKMKEAGFVHWDTSNTGATNISGFTALPGGCKDYSDGASKELGKSAFFLSATGSSGLAMFRKLTSANLNINNYSILIQLGASVRCLSDSTITEINDLNKTFNLQIFPNPSIDKIYIDCAIRQDLTMQIFNTVGQCVLKRELNTLTNTIDISSLTRGIYILKLTSPNGTIEKKIIKE